MITEKPGAPVPTQRAKDRVGGEEIDRSEENVIKMI